MPWERERGKADRSFRRTEGGRDEVMLIATESH